ncbi:BrnA antitoxin of type II toxin-antitoxin system [Breoghania corrubedonensis]|uniref:BrnA antitoxin of type II toxin-antitoxin system n=1 Tax=Breoghania corrubedonensis TaxID=665038 RepID=A0A2T5VFG0_9HYPH|nr:BrnA antitoxin family protein [Breoghania corrubedonensis]PTW62456.1 BrnA antitoxin of type II toxin-antitoxin system [Breoghania corrubedonensis]
MASHRYTSAKDQAEAMFKKVTTKPAPETPVLKRNPIPAGREVVTMKIDNDVLAHFQEAGPGWQERINAALRQAAGLEE